MRSRSHGFTLIELLMVVAIIGVLLALALPAASSAVQSARGFKCQVGLRSIAFDFVAFADDGLHASRGDDEINPALRGNRFRLETFQESQYGIDEFWEWGDQDLVRMPDLNGNDPMRCPNVKGEVTLRSNAPCTGGGVSPHQNVSYGFNIRLHKAERVGLPGPPVADVALDSSILQQTQIPLAWDVDGEAAAAQNTQPFFSGPSLDSPLVFADNRFWFPAMRHNGQAKFAFIDGHVASSARPLEEAGWRWGYTPSQPR